MLVVKILVYFFRELSGSKRRENTSMRFSMALHGEQSEKQMLLCPSCWHAHVCVIQRTAIPSRMATRHCEENDAMERIKGVEFSCSRHRADDCSHLSDPRSSFHDESLQLAARRFA
jgi:hypothetical protein